MNFLRNAMALIAGIVVGSLVNMGLIQLGHWMIPGPEGIDISTEEGLREALPLFTGKHFIFPWLAHAMGTLSGALVAARLAVTQFRLMALLTGVFFLVGGIMMISLISAPIWFAILDLLLAYLPMAYLGWLISGRPSK